MEKSIYSREYSLFTQLLRKLREEKGLTQQAVAAKLGVTQTFISKCERGERRLDVVELRAWCNALGVPMSEMLAELGLACGY
jgi:transcriptional regulator with XRE-family HTH domain